MSPSFVEGLASIWEQQVTETRWSYFQEGPWSSKEECGRDVYGADFEFGGNVPIGSLNINPAIESNPVTFFRWLEA